MLVLVLGCTQCLPQGVGVPPAMLRGRMAGFPKKTGRPGLRRGGVGGYNLHSVPPDSPPDCGTVAHQPRAGCICLVPEYVIMWNITFLVLYYRHGTSLKFYCGGGLSEGWRASNIHHNMLFHCI